MADPKHAVSDAARALLDDFSLEMTGKDVPALEDAAGTIPPGTLINVTFLGNEDLPMRVSAAAAVKRHGFVPVPHVSARRLASQAELEDFLRALSADAAPEDVFVVGGDPAEPMGPFADSLEVIRSGLLPKYGIRRVGISGYPEGHPDISDDVLWKALEDKYAELQQQNLESVIITQFGFDADPVFEWLAEVRRRGINAPVRIGVPGPAGVKRLLNYAKRFGVASSAGIVHKYGFSLTNLLGTAGPDKFLEEFASRYNPAVHGTVKLHFYTFGGMKATAEWVEGFRGGR
ncbi:methylenetetrahydrofolate reductase [Arthrobacter sulfonylureivorans]|uniref:Methylenetetrahydrofolate reductase n=1 Tax=Arthrobacter sulfonylureivorans TaxID=2486855 RepID=A0ABY3W7J4_9MICC|nr:methylenetetrahydrofolate reductase [Arthrobacter sulfonylureivorans]UNK46255.1 methylenetetrahydrofolate reductase [Arthrobacter sulfonylureivorans]